MNKIENITIVIDGIGTISDSDLSDYEKEIILDDLNDGEKYGCFKTLSDKTDDEVWLWWYSNSEKISLDIQEISDFLKLSEEQKMILGKVLK